MSNIRFSKITLWRAVGAIIFAAGLYATYARFFFGFSRATHLTDPQPSGLGVGFGTLCGVRSSAGGFAVAAAGYLLGFERYRPVVALPCFSFEHRLGGVGTPARCGPFRRKDIMQKSPHLQSVLPACRVIART